MNPNELRIVRLALSVVAERLLRVLALLTSFGAACWTLWGPNWERVVTLAIFVVFAYALTRTQQSEKRDELQADRPAAQ